MKDLHNALRQWNSSRKKRAARHIATYWKGALRKVDGGKKVHRSRVVKHGNASYNARNLYSRLPPVQLRNDDHAWLEAKWPTGHAISKNNGIAIAKRAEPRGNRDTLKKKRMAFYLKRVLEADRRLASAEGHSWLQKYTQHGWDLVHFYVFSKLGAPQGISVTLPMPSKWILATKLRVLGLYLGVDPLGVHPVHSRTTSPGRVPVYLSHDLAARSRPPGMRNALQQRKHHWPIR